MHFAIIFCMFLILWNIIIYRTLCSGTIVNLFWNKEEVPTLMRREAHGMNIEMKEEMDSFLGERGEIGF